MTTNREILSRAKAAWGRAQGFPPSKESVYPDHARAQEFDKRRPQELVLEYGCGGGSDTISYLSRGCRVTYVDIVEGNVEMTRQRVARSNSTLGHAGGIVLEESDRIPVPSSTFDVASSHGVIHHIPEPLPVLQEIRRVLKPGAALYVMLYTEHLFEQAKPLISQLTERFLIEENGQRVEHEALSVEEAFGWYTDASGCPYAVAYTEEEGRRLITSAGFVNVEVTAEYVGPRSNDFRTFRAAAT